MLHEPSPEDEHALVRPLVTRYGGAFANALQDPSVHLLRAPGIDGAVGYRGSWGSAIALGDPLGDDTDRLALAQTFRAHAHSRGLTAIFAGASAGFTEEMAALGCGAVRFGCEIILDPRRDPTAGKGGREARKKVTRALRAGVEVSEYLPGVFTDADLERLLSDVARSWLSARRGPQIFLAPVRLFSERSGRRWLYARCHQRVIGVLSMDRVRSGWLFEHVLATPDAPSGTTELLVVRALAMLGGEGWGFVSFGPAPSLELTRTIGLSWVSDRLARAVLDTCAHVFHLDNRTRYRKKFQPVRVEDLFVLFDPPAIGLREVYGLMRAFNVSLA
jgi:lysylphosphatidylglycerol synthetase-like protein (DUF2156 family)